MKTPRFFVNEKLNTKDEVTITNHAVIHQMRDVLRLSKGDRVILLDGVGNIYHGRVKVLLKKESILSKEILKKVSKSYKIKIKLFSSLIKKDKYEYVLQKGAEIGVEEFHPIVSQRTEKQKINLERSKKIIKEASEQSERAFLPEIFEPISLKDGLKDIKKDNSIVLDGSGEVLNVSQLKKDFKSKELNIFIGPEGGWSEEELDTFKEKGIKIYSLGENVLRAETASISITALLLLGK